MEHRHWRMFSLLFSFKSAICLADKWFKISQLYPFKWFIPALRILDILSDMNFIFEYSLYPKRYFIDVSRNSYETMFTSWDTHICVVYDRCNAEKYKISISCLEYTSLCRCKNEIFSVIHYTNKHLGMNSGERLEKSAMHIGKNILALCPPFI